jgi:hypothetical protein
MAIAVDEDKLDQAVLAHLSLGRHDGYCAQNGFNWDIMERLHRKIYIADPPGRLRETGGIRVAPEEAMKNNRSAATRLRSNGGGFDRGVLFARLTSYNTLPAAPGRETL